VDRQLVAAVAVAVATSLAAVGGVVWLTLGHPGIGSEIPVATRAAFCAEYSDPLAAMEMGARDVEFAEVWRDYGRRLEKTGLPHGAPERVRAGYRLFVEAALDTPDDIERQLEDRGVDGFMFGGAGGDAAMLAFDRWASRKCGLEDPLG
jgi:hypothetical protein